ncbi:MAG: ParB/RepB/Spo0J family partition protein [Gemmataceae bacterium]
METKRLGRGLNALLGDGASEKVATLPNGEVPLEQIQRNPNQPRKSFDPDELASLSASVRTHGILQPLVVRQVGETFQLIAGERRLRAAQDAGLAKVPVRIVDFNDQEVLEAALVENIQRQDLNPIEKAQGFKEHLDRFGLNHEQLAQRLGLARSTITNLVNLLELAQEVQDALRMGQISEAHAKLLKGIKTPEKQIAMYKQIVAMGLSVKAAEAMIREQRDGGTKASEGSSSRSGGSGGGGSTVEKTAHVKSIEDELRQRFATGFEIRLTAKDKGQFVIDFASNDDFERILEVIRK